ncbi:MAG: DNA/RNA nuclease SfsA [Rhodospirillaceae bacterium]|nr:DNA/RNA nuclease SfsA [Rhodospirillaceae bacterium]|tara:strand:+ start:189 stop:914 length:726 start_codon:yes stop_codon:yes gene_type:complete
MKFPDPLIPGMLIKRYKRFLPKIEISGADGAPDVITAHCANPGTMPDLTAPGSKVWVSPAYNPKQKLQYTWEVIRVGRHHVGINTYLPNRLVDEALAAGRIAELTGYANRRREMKYGANSRIDFLLEDPGRPTCYVEIKNVHLKRDPSDTGGSAEFPDSVTARGAKHLRELANVAESGARAVMLYIVQRADCDHFHLADDINPAYDEAFADARRRGVEAICYACDVSPERIDITHPLPIRP